LLLITLSRSNLNTTRIDPSIWHYQWYGSQIIYVTIFIDCSCFVLHALRNEVAQRGTQRGRKTSWYIWSKYYFDIVRYSGMQTRHGCHHLKRLAGQVPSDGHPCHCEMLVSISYFYPVNCCACVLIDPRRRDKALQTPEAHKPDRKKCSTKQPGTETSTVHHRFGQIAGSHYGSSRCSS
jgi:hypothetical protein